MTTNTDTAYNLMLIYHQCIDPIYHQCIDPEPGKLFQDSLEPLLIHLLTDLMHLADEYAVDFDNVLSTASLNYHDETIGL